jgi:hypothetical protein
MNNKLLHSGADGATEHGHGAAGTIAAVDQEALEAFVREAENGTYDDGDAEPLAAAVETVQAVLEAHQTAGPTPATTKWAEAAADSGAAAVAPGHPIDRIELPTAVDTAAARAAYDAVVEFLVAAGPATDGEIAGSVMPDHRLGYAPPSASDSEAGVWWEKIIKPALGVDPTVSYDPAYGYELGGRRA